MISTFFSNLKIFTSYDENSTKNSIENTIDIDEKYQNDVNEIKKDYVEYTNLYENIIKNFIDMISKDAGSFDIKKPKNDETNQYLVHAEPQMGKTKFTIASMLKTMIAKRIPILICRNRESDMKQFELNFSNYDIMLKEFAKLSIQNNSLDIDSIFKVEHIRCSLLKKKDVVEKIKSIHNDPIIIISLCNTSQLSRLVKLLNIYQFKYDLYIDEADHLDYGDGKCSSLIDVLKQKSYYTFSISATPFDIIMNEDKLKISNMIQINKPNDYRGFRDIEYLILPHKFKSIGNCKNVDEILECDKNIKPFLDRIVNDFCYTKSIDYSEIIPQIILMKVTRINKVQKILYDYIRKEYNFVTISYNGEGLRISFKNMPKDGIEIDGKIVKKNEDVRLDICSVLQYLKDNGGAQEFPKILIISGDLAGRCISYVSKDYIWHLTDLYHTPTNSINLPELIQSAGRLCGRNKGRGHLKYYSSEKIIDDLRKGVFSSCELLGRVKSQLIVDTLGHDATISDAIQTIPINKKKLPSKGRKFTSNKTSRKLVLKSIDGDDGGWDISEYNNNIIEKLYPDEDQNDDFIEDNIGDNMGDIIGYIDGVPINKLAYWYNSNLVVGRILKFLYSENRKVTMKEIQNGILYSGSDKQLFNNLTNGSGMKTQFGMLWKRDKDGYIQINKKIKKLIDSF